MKQTKLWATGISALFLSTSILSGVASAVDDTTTDTPTVKTPTEAKLTAAAALKDLNTSIADAKLAVGKVVSADDEGKKKALKEAIDVAETLAKKEDATSKELTDAKSKLDAATKEVKDAAIAKTKADEAERNAAKADLSKAIESEVKTAKKPTKLVDAYKKALAEARKVEAELSSKTEDIKAATNKLTDAITKVTDAKEVYKIATDDAGKLTINFETADKQTRFPKSAGQTMSSSDVTSDTKYVEVNQLNDLVNTYKLELPKGFEIANPEMMPKSDAEVTRIVLKQKADAKFSEVLVKFNFLRDGKVIDSSLPSFTSLQEVDVNNSANDLFVEMSATQMAALKKYYKKDGYVVEEKDAHYKFEGNNFYQEKTINFVTKPVIHKIDAPDFTSFNGYKFKAGIGYSLTKQVELYLKQGTNEQLSNNDYDIKVVSVTKVGSKKNLYKGKTFIFTQPKAQYTVKFRVSGKDGALLEKSNGKLVKTVDFSNTANTVDSAPVFNTVKNGTFKVGTFNALKGISAYDYVDKKYVKVTYSTYKYNTKTKKYDKVTSYALAKTGKYKLVYSAKDSKGYKASKTRYVTIKK